MGVFPCAGKVNEGIQQWGVGVCESITCVWFTEEKRFVQKKKKNRPVVFRFP